jgi:hypothetical protein
MQHHASLCTPHKHLCVGEVACQPSRCQYRGVFWVKLDRPGCPVMAVQRLSRSQANAGIHTKVDSQQSRCGATPFTHAWDGKASCNTMSTLCSSSHAARGQTETRRLGRRGPRALMRSTDCRTGVTATGWVVESAETNGRQTARKTVKRQTGRAVHGEWDQRGRRYPWALTAIAMVDLTDAGKGALLHSNCHRTAGEPLRVRKPAGTHEM